MNAPEYPLKFPWGRLAASFCLMFGLLFAAGLICLAAGWHAWWQRMLAYGAAGGLARLTIEAGRIRRLKRGR